MLTSLTIPSDGGFYTIPNQNVFFEQLAGLGNPDVKLGIHDYAQSRGGSFQFQDYKSRTISLGGTIKADDVATFAQVRRSLSQALSFLGELKTIQGVTDDAVDVQFDVVAASDLAFDYNAGFVNALPWSISLLLPDPFIYSQELFSAIGGVAALAGVGFSLPFSLPLALAGSVTGTINVLNNGNTRIKPQLITITGPGTNFTISNKTTGKDLFFNDTLLATDTLVIDPNRFTAYKNGVTNKYGLMSGSWWDLYYGNNTIALQVGSGNTSNTGITVSWRNAYLAT
jgi:hypothetical protein